MECCGKQNNLVAIPASLGGIFMVITVLFMIFARDQMGLLIPILWAFVVLGVVGLLVSLQALKIK